MKNRLLFFILFLIVTSCSQKSQYFSAPNLLGIESVTPNSITLSFDQPVSLSNIVLDPALTLDDYAEQTIFFSQANVAHNYYLEATASYGLSSLHFSLYFMAVPIHPPVPLVINELSIIHNTKNTNAIELRALATGNLAGTTIYLGTPSDYRARFVFHEYPVRKDDLIILHADKEEGFFFIGSPKLSNTREIITIAQHPYSTPYYGMAYEKASGAEAKSAQKRTFEKNYLYLLEKNLWMGSPIDTTYVTATRSLNRLPDPSHNPESAIQWYVTVASGSSIGSPNNPNHFRPKAPAK